MLSATAPAGLDRLRTGYGKSQLRFAALQGQARALRERQADLASAVSLSKARIELAPAAAEVFNLLQERAHQRAVGVFEDLLSAFVADVFPEGGSRVELALGTERGAPALDIQLNNEGDVEDILEGNGGALTNVVSTGLVYAALSRTAARPMVVLDEPDCWLKPSRVPAFTRVIAEVSTKAGVQTLLISHHEPELIDPDINLIELVLKDDKPAAVPVGVVRAWADDAEPGLRWIELENVRRHVSTHIPLFPGANALVGDNNLGKSTAFSAALRAMAYGEMSDNLISHRADAVFIRIGLENQVVLEMERRRNPAGGMPKLVYRRYEAGTLTNEAAPKTRGTVPEFVTAALRVDYVDGLDIQVRSQKQPVFLLNETPSRRAQLLSVGRESGLLQAVIEKHRLTLKRDRDQVRRDEAELNQVNRKLDALAPLTGLAALVEIMDALQAEAASAAEAFTKAQRIVTQTLQLQVRVDCLSPVDVNERALPSLPEVTDTAVLAQLVQRLSKYGALAGLPDTPALPAAPAIADSTPLAGLTSRLERATLLAGIASLAEQGPQVPAVPELMDRTVLVQTGKRVRECETGVGRLEKETADAQKDEKAADQALHDLRDKLGVCPLCNAALNKDTAA